MATTVHVHYYRGVSQLPKISNRQFSSDSTVALHEPPLAGGANTITGTASTLSSAPDRTEVCRVQVADGGKVRYAVINEANTAVADADSPAMTGEVIIQFNGSWSLSLIEA